MNPSIESYLKAQRIPLSYGHGKKLARRGELQGCIENAQVRAFSSEAIDKLGTIRVANDDGTAIV